MEDQNKETIVIPEFKIPSVTLEKGKRIEILDSLRGFALAGILITHMIHFYYFNFLPPSVEANYLVGMNKFIKDLDFRLIVDKFFLIFTFLFGISFCLQKKLYSNKKIPFDTWFFKRLVVLLFIGLIHYSVGKSDILISYSLIGFSLIFLSKLPSKWILLISIFFISGIPGLYIRYLGESTGFLQDFYNHHSNLKIENYKYFLANHGSLLSNIQLNYHYIDELFVFGLFNGRYFLTIGFFLLGIYCEKNNMFSNYFQNQKLFTKIFLYGISFLGLMILVKYWFKSLDIQDNEKRDILNYYYNIFLVITYISAYCLLNYSGFLRKFFNIFISVGKTAISNYLFQTLVGVSLFFGYGLGLMYKISAPKILVITLVILSFEIILSKLWLKFHKYGPIEGIWRYLTNISWLGF